jgi:D-alanyl-D-alanine carboxypeptidase
MPLQALAINTSATSAILVDADSKRVLYEQNADRKMLIASTTKIMTALVALRNGNLSDEVTVSKNAAHTEGSSMYLKAGETLTLETLLYGLMLCSGNDAAVAIAEHIGGSVDQFARMMNETAQALEMTSSSFANPNGLDHELHYSTARDMAKLACAAMENEMLVRIVSTKQITIDGRSMSNHNKLLSYQEGCLGLKTGYTKAAGRTLVSCAEKDGQHLVAVTLQDGNDWADHQALYDYGFSAYPLKYAAVIGRPIEYYPVVGGERSQVSLVAAESFAWPVAANEKLKMTVEVKQELCAPLIAGTIVGEAVFSLDGCEVGRVRLLCGETVAPRVESALSVLKLYLPQ